MSLINAVMDLEQTIYDIQGHEPDAFCLSMQIVAETWKSRLWHIGTGYVPHPNPLLRYAVASSALFEEKPLSHRNVMAHLTGKEDIQTHQPSPLCYVEEEGERVFDLPQGLAAISAYYVQNNLYMTSSHVTRMMRQMFDDWEEIGEMQNAFIYTFFGNAGTIPYEGPQTEQFRSNHWGMQIIEEHRAGNIDLCSMVLMVLSDVLKEYPAHLDDRYTKSEHYLRVESLYGTAYMEGKPPSPPKMPQIINAFLSPFSHIGFVVYVRHKKRQAAKYHAAFQITDDPMLMK